MTTQHHKIYTLITKIYNYQAQKLCLRNYQIKEADLRFMLKQFSGELKHLQLMYCGITDSFIGLFLDTNLTRLLVLDISRNIIGNSGIKILIKANIPNLKTLCLCHTHLQNEATKTLTKGKWPNLCHISLRKNPIEIDCNYINSLGYRYVRQYIELDQISQLVVLNVDAICSMDFILINSQSMEVDKLISNKFLEFIIDVIYRQRWRNK